MSVMIVFTTIIGLLAFVGIVGMIDGRLRWGSDYWKYGGQGCALLEAGWKE